MKNVCLYFFISLFQFGACKFSYAQSCIAPAPYYESFEGPTFQEPSLPNKYGSINTCWSRGSVPYFASYYWMPETSARYTSPWSGPEFDHTTGTGKFMVANHSFNSFHNSLTWFQSPHIDLSSLTNPELVFFYHMFGLEIEKLEVQIDTGGGWGSEMIIAGQQHLASNDKWSRAVLNLSSYANKIIDIRFVAVEDSTIQGAGNRIAIDDVRVDEMPLCREPMYPEWITSASTSVKIGWVDGGAGQWEVEYGPQGYTPGSGTIVNAPTNPYSIPGLAPDTEYDVYVRDKCGAGNGSSVWVGPVYARTKCSVNTAPWGEDFDGVRWKPGVGAQVDFCWSPDSVDPAWTIQNTNTPTHNTGPSMDVSGSGNYIYWEAAKNRSGNGGILSPHIYIPPTMVQPMLYFYYHMYGADIKKLEINIEVGATFSNIYQLSGEQQSSETDPWIKDSVDLTAYISDTIRLQLSSVGPSWYWFTDMALDNISIEEKPCPPIQAHFTFTQNQDTVSFNTAGSNGFGMYYWDFGDGTTDTGFVPIHIYTNPGSYLVELTMVNYCGDSSVVTDTVHTCVAPTAKWSYTIIGSGGNGMNVQFDATSSVNAKSYEWNFGDGTTNVGTPVPLHTYAVAALSYQVSLKIKNDCNESDIKISSLAEIDLDEFNSDLGIHIYPNPVNEVLHLKWKLPHENIKNVSLYNSNGRLLLKQSASSVDKENNSMNIPVNNLPEGFYLLEVNERNFQSVYKIIVQH